MAGDGEQITDYVILTHDKAEELEDEVKRLLADGWELLGGVAVAVFPAFSVRVPNHGVVEQGETPTFVQAMIRRGDRSGPGD